MTKTPPEEPGVEKLQQLDLPRMNIVKLLIARTPIIGDNADNEAGSRGLSLQAVQVTHQ